MNESVRIVEYTELIQFANNSLYKNLFRFLQGFNQTESIHILKTLKLIAKNFQRGKSFEHCDNIYKEHFLEHYINRTKNAHSIGFLHYLYLDGIWHKYKFHLLEIENKYTFELTNDYKHDQKDYLNQIIGRLDEFHDLVLVDYERYNAISKLVLPASNDTLKENIDLQKDIKLPHKSYNSLNIIIQDSRDKLYDFLAIYFKKSDHKELKTLINGGEKSNGEKLLFSGMIMEFTSTFRLLKQKKIIKNSKKELSFWICENFNCLHEGVIKPCI